MEGDGPTGSMVIPEFYALKLHLAARADQMMIGDGLLPMVASMQARVDKYFEEALQCDTTVMASLLNPHFRLRFYEHAFGKDHHYTKRAKKLFMEKFDQRKKEMGPSLQTNKCSSAASTKVNASKTTTNTVFQLFKAQEPEIQHDEINAYLKGANPMAASEDARDSKSVLPWWKVCPFFYFNCSLFTQIVHFHYFLVFCRCMVAHSLFLQHQLATI